MRLEKLICATTVIISSFMTASLVQSDFLAHKVSRYISNLGILKFRDERALVFFVLTQGFLLGYASIKTAVIVFPGRLAKRLRRSHSEQANSFFLLFACAICAYVFKFDMGVLLSNVVFSVFCIYASVAFSLAKARIVSFFFLCCVLSSNTFVFCATFLSDFSAVRSIVSSCSRKFRLADFFA